MMSIVIMDKLTIMFASIDLSKSQHCHGRYLYKQWQDQHSHYDLVYRAPSTQP